MLKGVEEFFCRSDGVGTSIMLIIIGIVIVIISFFIEHKARSYADDLEKMSISLQQETNGLKMRLKAVEEELLIGIGLVSSSKQPIPKNKPVHEILVNRLFSLHTQGLSVEAIAKRSSLTTTEVTAVLRSKGVN